MATVWMTYAWDDNDQGDVDFLAQELVGAGLNVKLDRWNLSAGSRLWEQIANFIADPAESDAWVLIATSNSLSSEACREEFSYALGRALEQRGGEYPVIGLFIGPVDDALIPPGIKNRLYVSATDPDWKERITAAAEGRSPGISTAAVQPYAVTVHDQQPGDSPFAIEVRPRAGTWAPFVAAVPKAEKEAVRMRIMIGPRGRPTGGGVLMMTRTGENDEWHFSAAGNEATPTMSYYVWCATLPSRLAFGVDGGEQHVVEFTGQ